MHSNLRAAHHLAAEVVNKRYGQIVFLSPPWLFELLNFRFQYFTLHAFVHGLKEVQVSISTSSEDTADFLKHT